MSITNHTELLNALIQKHNLKSYLEVGVQDPRNNFEKIKCEIIMGVDPEIKAAAIPSVFFVGTSDEFFLLNKRKYSLIFIDGLHTAEQVKRDFENSLRCLTDNGFILIHDVLPENEEGTLVPRQTKKWWGDVYKFAMNIGQYDGIGFKTFDIDEGCMLVWKGERFWAERKMPEVINWNSYKSIGRKLMNVVDEVNI